jgi:hypothetical protein
MCFSATASFAVGAGLIAPSYYSISKTESRQMLMLASTPVVFSALQIAEGFLWLSLQHHDYASWYKPSLYSYSFISQAVWPAWATLAVWMMEADKCRKKILNYFVLLGIASSLYMIYCLLTSNISAAAENGHIRYYREFPFLNAGFKPNKCYQYSSYYHQIEAKICILYIVNVESCIKVSLSFISWNIPDDYRL